MNTTTDTGFLDDTIVEPLEVEGAVIEVVCEYRWYISGQVDLDGLMDSDGEPVELDDFQRERIRRAITQKHTGGRVTV